MTSTSETIKFTVPLAKGVLHHTFLDKVSLKGKRNAEMLNHKAPLSKGKGKLVRTNRPKPQKSTTLSQACQNRSKVGKLGHDCPKYFEDKKVSFEGLFEYSYDRYKL